MTYDGLWPLALWGYGVGGERMAAVLHAALDGNGRIELTGQEVGFDCWDCVPGWPRPAFAGGLRCSGAPILSNTKAESSQHFAPAKTGDG